MSVYRILLTLLSPLLVLWALVRFGLRHESWRTCRARLGFLPGGTESGRSAIWVHAASNGELASAASVIRVLHDARPDLDILVTTNTPSARRLASSWRLARVHAEIAPFDTAWAARRVLTQFHVSALVLLEAEFWPNRIVEAARRDLPVMVIGARLSRKSARGWRRFSGLAQQVLGALRWLLPQDAKTPRRLNRLGLAPERVGPVIDLKALYSAKGLPAPGSDLVDAFPRDETWLAASTHPGEDQILLEAHRRALETRPNLRLIIAPRHPKRAGEVRQLARKAGFDIAQRSLGDAPRPDAIYIADTLGEMAQLYPLASACFVAGSLSDFGGHTPYEPIAHGCAILHGPHTESFRSIYRRLDTGGGALQAANAEDVAHLLIELRDPTRAAALSQIARTIAQSEGSPEDVVGRILAELP